MNHIITGGQFSPFTITLGYGRPIVGETQIKCNHELDNAPVVADSMDDDPRQCVVDDYKPRAAFLTDRGC